MYHPVAADWLADYEDELLRFPYGPHDDMVDAASYVSSLLTRMSRPQIISLEDDSPVLDDGWNGGVG